MKVYCNFPHSFKDGEKEFKKIYIFKGRDVCGHLFLKKNVCGHLRKCKRKNGNELSPKKANGSSNVVIKGTEG